MTVSCSESEDQADVTPLHVTGRFDDSTDEVPAWRFDIEANVDQVAAGAVHDLATIDGNDGYDDTRTSVLVMASEGRDRSVTYGDVPGASGRLRFIRASCGET